MSTGMDVLSTSMLNGLLKQIAEKDKRIAELEKDVETLAGLLHDVGFVHDNALPLKPEEKP